MLDFLKKYKYVLIAVFLLTVASISYVNYKNTEQIILDKYDQRRQLVETSIIKSFERINDTYRIAERQLNKEMEEYSFILSEYYKNNPDVSSWDLDHFKEQFNDYDIYIINNDLEVIRSTFEKDIGLDFKQFPSFSKILKARLQGNSFAVDRLDLETNTGKLKKYSYMPTPDNKYLLELSADIQQKYPVLKNINIFAEAESLVARYNLVSEISFYKYSPLSRKVGKLRTTRNPVQTDITSKEKEYVKKAFETGETQRIDRREGTANGSTYIPALVENKNDGASWWNSFVVGIDYNNINMSGEIDKNRNLFLTNTLLMGLAFIIFMVIIIYLLKRFHYLAYHDQLTGLSNRELFMENTNNMINTAGKRENKMAVIFIDINNFKDINDNFGHGIGDEILTRTAIRLQSGIRESDCISRLGGDEFTISISSINSRKEIERIVERIIKLFKKPIEVDGHKLTVDISMGISVYPEQGRTLKQLIKNADDAMYQAKQQQKDFVLFGESM